MCPIKPLARRDLLNGEFHGWSTFLESRTLRVPTTLTNQASCRRGSAFCPLAERENRLDSRSERVRLKASFLCSVRFRLFLAGVAMSQFLRRCAIDFAALLAALALILFVCLTWLRVTSTDLTTNPGVSCCPFYPFFASFANRHDMLTGLIW